MDNKKPKTDSAVFNRFLSYIYAYEGEKKLRNVGFAKVELRFGRIRLQVSLNGISQKGKNALEIFMLDNHGSKYHIGNIVIQNGHGDYFSSSCIENVYSTGKSFDNINGIYIQGTGGKHNYYRTLWKELEKISATEASCACESEEIETCDFNVDKHSEIRSEAEPEIRLEAGVKNSALVNDAGIKALEKPVKNKVIEVKLKDFENKNIVKNKEEDKAIEVKRSDENKDDLGSFEDIHVKKRLERWKKFCRRYPHVDIRPCDENGNWKFEEEGVICEVIRIKPNDISFLPRNQWILAGNGFVRNMAAKRKALIIFRVLSEKNDLTAENRWYFGVYGSDSSEETMVASVFGFKKYLKCKRGGFWYTQIDIGE